SIPVGIPLFAVLCLTFIIKKVAKKFAQNKSVTASCVIYCGKNKAVCSGFYDSGNNVYCGGAPVSIIPAYVAKKLTEKERIKNSVDIHTVAGKSKIKVFTADKIEIDDGKNKYERKNVLLGVSPQLIYKVVLHPDLSEVN
ncbi:MAG: sigma-E processing peptidase SpoIIGA, partial [Clostridia bacterium]|nr:sigma-E processing peptidase SpoIIGA [Clostridia bacterium]